MLFPHTVARRFIEEGSTSDREVLGTGYGPAVMCEVHLSPTSADSAFRDWGVELTRPYFLCYEGTLADMPVGTLLSDAAGKHWVVKAVNEHSFGNAADHCSGLAELLQFDPVSVDPAFMDVSGVMALSGASKTVSGSLPWGG